MINRKVDYKRVRELNYRGHSDHEIGKILKHSASAITYARYAMNLPANFRPWGDENVANPTVAYNARKRYANEWVKNHPKQARATQQRWAENNREYKNQWMKDYHIRKKEAKV
jgi:hypothetical protein